MDTFSELITATAKTKPGSTIVVRSCSSRCASVQQDWIAAAFHRAWLVNVVIRHKLILLPDDRHIMFVDESDLRERHKFDGLEIAFTLSCYDVDQMERNLRCQTCAKSISKS